MLSIDVGYHFNVAYTRTDNWKILYLLLFLPHHRFSLFTPCPPLPFPPPLASYLPFFLFHFLHSRLFLPIPTPSWGRGAFSAKSLAFRDDKTVQIISNSINY